MKPVGNNVLIKITKTKSTIELLPNTPRANEEQAAIIEEIGTKCSLGLEKGHEVMFKSNVMPLVVDETEEFDLWIVPEISILLIKNWKEKEETTPGMVNGGKL